MCVESLLALKGCTEQTPSTGLYIDSVGITKNFLSQLITEQYDLPEELFADKRDMAWRKVQTLMLNSINKFFKADTVIENRAIGQISQDYTLTTPSTGSYNGIRLTMSPQTTSFLKLFIKDIQIYVNESNTNVPVLVFDLTTGKLIDTITYLVGGENQFLGKEYLSNRKKLDIAIVYESTFDSIKTIPRKGSCTDCSGRVKEVAICPFVNAIGVQLDWDGTSLSNVAYKPVTYGMSINYNVNCDRDSYLCSVGATMSMALMYATAVECYDYALTISPSERINTTVTYSAEELIKARDIMSAKFNDEMNLVVANFRMPSDRHCFRCNENMKFLSLL